MDMHRLVGVERLSASSTAIAKVWGRAVNLLLASLGF